MSRILGLACPQEPGYLVINMASRDRPLLLLVDKMVLIIDGAEELILLLVSVLFKLVSMTEERQ